MGAVDRRGPVSSWPWCRQLGFFSRHCRCRRVTIFAESSRACWDRNRNSDSCYAGLAMMCSGLIIGVGLGSHTVQRGSLQSRSAAGFRAAPIWPTDAASNGRGRHRRLISDLGRSAHGKPTEGALAPCMGLADGSCPHLTHTYAGQDQRERTATLPVKPLLQNGIGNACVSRPWGLLSA
jgi:hypothetical protein